MAIIATRIYACLQGLRFDASSGRDFWHAVDPALLETDLLRTLWHLHSQPPLFNGGLGVYQKAFGSQVDFAFQITFLLVGAAIAQQTFLLARLCTLGRWWAAAIAVSISCSPAALLFENFLFYSYPELLLLLAGTNATLLAIRAQIPFRWLLALAASLCALCLLRAMFHPVWALGMFGLTAWMCGARLRLRHLAIAAAPFLLVALVSAKNYVLFDSSSLSSWRGMNLARVTIDRLPKSVRKSWVEDGTLSSVAGVGGFKPLASYDSVLARPDATGVAVLDQVAKPSGSPNFHHLGYLRISRQLQQDAWVIIRDRPDLYAKSVIKNLQTTFEPAWQYRALSASRVKVEGYATAWATVLGLPLLPGQTSAWLVLTPLLLAFAVGRLFRDRRKWREAWFAGVLLCVLNIGYVVVVGALLERSENQRFRFDVDPMIGVLAALTLRELWLKARLQMSTSR